MLIGYEQILYVRWTALSLRHLKNILYVQLNVN